MDIRELIGQKLVFGFRGTKLPEDFFELVKKYKIANVILFKYNVESSVQLRALCADIQRLIIAETGHPAFITIDQEGGMVSRMPSDAVTVPGNMAVAATGNINDAYTAAAISARQLRALGVNFNLAPDLDVNSNSANPVIGVRSFGDAPENVAALAKMAVKAYADNGVLCCGKHFPGHGDTAVDSHIGLPRVGKSLSELEKCELVPFKAAIEAGIPAIMSSHILFPQLDGGTVPATMSRGIMHGILREKLGFGGLILSDCMVMDAIKKHYGTANGVVAAMNAGIDLVFVSSNIKLQAESAENAISAALSGALNINALTESYNRILECKEKYAFTDCVPGLSGRSEDFTSARDIARRAVTAVQGKPVLGENNFFCGCADYRVTQAANADPDAVSFPEYMKRCFGGQSAICSADPDENEIMALVEAAKGCDCVVMSTCNAHIFKGQLRLAEALSSLSLPMTVVTLRNPYDLPLLPERAAKLAAWDYSADSLSAVAQVLRGGECYGKMPVKLVK